MPTFVPFAPVPVDPLPPGWWDDLLTTVLSRIEGVALPFVQDAARRVLDTFLRRTTLWRELSEEADLVPGEQSLVIDPGPGIEPVACYGVAVDGHDLRVIAPRSRPMAMQAGMPEFFAALSPRQILLYPIPAAAGQVQALLAATVTKIATDMALPSVLTQYQEYLLAGIEAELMLVPSRPWSDAQVGASKRRYFNVGVQTGRTQAYGGFTPNAVTWAYPVWA